MKYKQDQKVEFNVDGSVKGTGKVVGLATNGDHIIGLSYIIEPDDISKTGVSYDIYPYSHFVCWEMHLKSI